MRSRKGASAASPLEGILDHHGRFAFLLAREGQDVFIKGPTLRLAEDGDTVRVRLIRGRAGRPMGEIVAVLRRARNAKVGEFREVGGRWFVFPENAGPESAVEVQRISVRPPPKPFEWVVVEIRRWPTLNKPAAGDIVERLGSPNQPGVRLRAILRSKGIAETFSNEALEQAASMPKEVRPEHWKGRKTLFDRDVFTIDGADAKDFDDAVSIERKGSKGWRLGVHIADVSHYVLPGSPLDREAYGRGTSVYLADRVVPMLPPSLSDELCSLKPAVPRLTFSVFIDLDAEGRPGRVRCEKTVIRSARRFTYEEVETLLKGKRVPRVPISVKKAVLEMGRLAGTLRKRRWARGALDFDLPEFRVVCAPDGSPLDILKRERLESHRLIEEFMLAANEAVARELFNRKRSFLWRVHEPPEIEKLEALAIEVRELGIEPPPNIQDRSGKGLQALLRRVREHPLESLVHYLTVRSLKQAQYAPNRGKGHFGLASSYYCHFTSPIRRYPDLLVHRALSEALQGSAGRPRPERLLPPGTDLPSAGNHCSETERSAAGAERDSIQVLRAELLGGRLGERFEGTVVSHGSSGAMVELRSIGGTGLLRGVFPPLGTVLQVRVSEVDPAKGNFELELELRGGPKLREALVSASEEKARKRRVRRGRQPNKRPKRGRRRR